jgi:hypothetical protein
MTSVIPKGATMSLAHVQARRAPTLEYRLLVALSFAIFLVVELVSRLVPRAWLGQSGERGSVFREARAAARRTVPLVFMG